MKRINKFIYFSGIIILNLFITVFAQDESESSGFLSKIDANFLMGNFHKIILIIVALGCIAGLIYSNIMSRKK